MTTATDIVFNKFVASMIGWLLGQLGKKVKERWALGKAINTSLVRLKQQEPKNYKLLFGSTQFWSAFADEFSNLLDPNKQPNIERLANKIESSTSIPRKDILNILVLLFDFLREEMAKKPDLMLNEQYRTALRLEGKLSKLCDELGIEQSIDSLDRKASIAAKNALNLSFPSLFRPKHLMNIDFQAKEDEQFIDIDAVCLFMELGYKILLEAEPGGGKSTTLYQLSEKLLLDKPGLYPIFISLPLWYEEKTFLEYTANQEAFSEQNLSEKNLQSLARHGHLILILDGWNELPRHKLDHARTKLLNFQKDYPDVSILIASRQNTLPPELRMVFKISLQRLRPAERNYFIKNSLGDDLGRRLINELDSKQTLEDFTFIPFYLSMLVNIFKENQTLPDTKGELIHKFVAVYDSKTDLRERLQNNQQDYLTALSLEMLSEGTTTLGEEKATSIIHIVGEKLKSQGKLSAIPKSLEVLDVLASYHLLVFTGEVWQFQHQQFQEWYASHYVEKVITDAFVSKEPNSLHELRENILNIPRWEEPLFFAVERMVKMNCKTQLSALILHTLEIEPLLASEIIYRVNEDIWAEVKQPICSYIQDWHEPERIDRALAFMISSGRPEFSNLIWPLVTHPNHQIRLQAIRTFDPFRTNCLGNQWFEELQKHPEEIRRDFLSEIAHSRGMEGIEFAVEAALKDESTAVKLGVIDTAEFRALYSQIAKILENASEDLWKTYSKRADLNTLKFLQIEEKVKNYLSEVLENSTAPKERFHLLAKLIKLGDEKAQDKLFELLVEMEIDEANEESRFAYNVYEVATEISPQRVANIIITKMLEEKRLPYGIERFLEKASDDDKKRLALAISENAVEHCNEECARFFDIEEVLLLINTLLDKTNEIEALKPTVNEEVLEYQHRLERFLKHLQGDVAILSILELSGKTKPKKGFRAIISKLLTDFGKMLNVYQPTPHRINTQSEIATILHFLSWTLSPQGEEPQSENLVLPENVSNEFRDLLYEWVGIIKAESKNPRGTLADQPRQTRTICISL